MRTPANDTASLAPTFETLRVGRLTWTGLGLAALGWTAYLGATLLGELIVAGAKHALPGATHGDLVDVAKSVIASGFALAIIGALHSGFGTLNRFFAAVLSRSLRKDAEAAPTPMERPTPTVAPISKRPYRMFADGSVEVDTIVGTRLFKTMNEARDFI